MPVKAMPRRARAFADSPQSSVPAKRLPSGSGFIVWMHERTSGWFSQHLQTLPRRLVYLFDVNAGTHGHLNPAPPRRGVSDSRLLESPSEQTSGEADRPAVGQFAETRLIGGWLELTLFGQLHL
jgi:hypothetical protein